MPILFEKDQKIRGHQYSNTSARIFPRNVDTWALSNDTGSYAMSILPPSTSTAVALVIELVLRKLYRSLGESWQFGSQ